MIKSISYPQYDHLYSVRLFNRINHPTHELAPILNMTTCIPSGYLIV